MPKQKTRKGVATRVRVTRTGKRKRALRRKATVARADVTRTKRAMH